MRKLFLHQKKVLKWVLTQRHPLLFLEMRLGKNLIVLRALKIFKSKKVLVVAPYSALFSWMTEISEEQGEYISLFGSRAERLKTLSENKDGIYLINKEGFLSLPEIRNVSWNDVILDESTFIKNPKPKVSKFFLNNFLQVNRRWCLTGCPNPENQFNLFNQIFWSYRTALGVRTFWDFRAKYGKLFGFDWILTKEGKNLIQTFLKDKAYILTKKDIKKDNLKTYIKRVLELPANLRKQYHKIESDFILELDGAESLSTVWATGKYQWLRQFANGFIDGRLIHSIKVDEVLLLLDTELHGQQVVILSDYVAELKHLSEVITDSVLITGNTKVNDRAKYINDFKNQKIRVLIAQTETLKYGANLATSDTIIYFSAPASAETRLQTEERIGLLNKTNTLLYIDIIIKDTEDDPSHLKTKGKILSAKTFLSRSKK